MCIDILNILSGVYSIKLKKKLFEINFLLEAFYTILYICTNMHAQRLYTYLHIHNIHVGYTVKVALYMHIY